MYDKIAMIYGHIIQRINNQTYHDSGFERVALESETANFCAFSK